MSAGIESKDMLTDDSDKAPFPVHDIVKHAPEQFRDAASIALKLGLSTATAMAVSNLDILPDYERALIVGVTEVLFQLAARQIKQKSPPNQTTQETLKIPCGLVNTDSVCYQNCVLQSLRHCTEFNTFSEGPGDVPHELRKLRYALSESSTPVDAEGLRQVMGHPWNGEQRGSSVDFLKALLAKSPLWKEATMINEKVWWSLTQADSIKFVYPQEGLDLSGLIKGDRAAIAIPPKVLIVGLMKTYWIFQGGLTWRQEFRRRLVDCPMELPVMTADGQTTTYDLIATIQDWKSVHAFAHVYSKAQKAWFKADDERVSFIEDDRDVVTGDTFLLFYQARS